MRLGRDPLKVTVVVAVYRRGDFLRDFSEVGLDHVKTYIPRIGIKLQMIKRSLLTSRAPRVFALSRLH